MKHPIVGDPIYGQSEEEIIRYLDKETTPEERLKLGGATRLLLHASQLDFEYKHNRYSIHSKRNFAAETSICFTDGRFIKQIQSNGWCRLFGPCVFYAETRGRCFM